MEHSPWALKPFTNPNQDVSSFRVFPCSSVAMLMLSCPTVANVSGSERCVFNSVQFRVDPWQIFCFFYLINSDHSKTKRPTGHDDPWVSENFSSSAYYLMALISSTWAAAKPLPKVLKSLNVQTTFLSRVISKSCGFSGPAWQLPTMMLPLGRT